jgi:hypothetical protein
VIPAWFRAATLAFVKRLPAFLAENPETAITSVSASSIFLRMSPRRFTKSLNRFERCLPPYLKPPAKIPLYWRRSSRV